MAEKYYILENPRKKIHDFGAGLGVQFSASPNERRTA